MKSFNSLSIKVDTILRKKHNRNIRVKKEYYNTNLEDQKMNLSEVICLLVFQSEFNQRSRISRVDGWMGGWVDGWMSGWVGR